MQDAETITEKYEIRESLHRIFPGSWKSSSDLSKGLFKVVETGFSENVLRLMSERNVIAWFYQHRNVLD